MTLDVREQPLTEALGDLSECNKEALHLFSSVQAHGCFLGFTWPDGRIQCASENVEAILKQSHKQVLGSKLEQVLDKDLIAKIKPYLEMHPLGGSRGRYIRHTVGEETIEAFLFESEGLFCLELERLDPGVATESDMLDTDQVVADFMGEAKETRTLEELANAAARAVLRVTGIDRVTIYRFLAPTWHGEVIAEDRVPQAHSFLGHFFPASDIPQPARDLYLRNGVRSIPDASGEVSPIVPSVNPLTQKTLDLSDSRLRSVSKIHLEYLRNMGVGASFSIAITVEGHLWGLIACHHMKPFHIARARWVHCEIIANALSSRAAMLEELQAAKEKITFDKGVRAFFDRLRSSGTPVDDFLRLHRSLEEIFAASGIGLVRGEHVDSAGMAPARSDLIELSRWLEARMRDSNKNYVALDSISSAPNSERLRELVCGVLAVRLPSDQGLLMLFRPEIVRTITWGGDPRKQLEKKGFQGRINPRESFHAWEETVRGKTVEWERHEIDGLLLLTDLVFDVLEKPRRLIQELREARGQKS